MYFWLLLLLLLLLWWRGGGPVRSGSRWAAAPAAPQSQPHGIARHESPGDRRPAARPPIQPSQSVQRGARRGSDVLRATRKTSRTRITMSRSTMVLPDSTHWVERLVKYPADPRVQDWPMMGSAAWPLTVAAAYLYFVLSYGPKLMKSKEAYSFKTFIYCYNVYQVIANSLMFYTVLTSGWTTTYTLGCQYVDRSDSPEAMRMASAMWYWFLLKQTELIETVLFVLRKKKRQISFLHVYHHVSTFFIAWIACNFAPGGLTTFSVMPNSAVHVMLYSYYLLSAIDNEALRKRLNTFKKYLTTIQIIQLAVIVAHSSQALLPSCNAAPKTLAYSYVPNVLLVIYLFYNFYRVNYRAAAKRTAAAAVTPVTAAAARDLSFTTPTSERRAKEE